MAVIPPGGSQMFNWRKAFAVGRANLVMALDELVLKRYAVKAAEAAKPMTPVKFGTLRASLTGDVGYGNREYQKITGKEVGKLVRLVGSSLPYAAKMEYEHKTKSHFIHKGIQKVLPSMRKDAVRVAKGVLGNAWNGG